jgi:hypothetical protein
MKKMKKAFIFSIFLTMLFNALALANMGPDSGDIRDCKSFCEMIAFCKVACVPNDCEPYCNNRISNSDYHCASLDSCAEVSECLCGDTDSGSSGQGGCSVTKGGGDLWLPLSLLLIGLAAMTVNFLFKRNRQK